MVVVYFIGLFIHVFHRLKVEWLWISVAFWAVDRSLRLLRLLWINIPWTNPRHGFSRATIQCYSGDILRISVQVVQPWKYRPGQSVYLYFPGLRYGFWQSHPFSILSSSDDSEEVEDELSVLPTDPQIRDDGTTYSDESDKLLGPSFYRRNRKHKKTRYFTFLVKAQTGLTRRLQAKIKEGTSKVITALVEGPYGISDAFDVFPSVLFISGGVAISYTMSHLLNLLQIKAENPAAKVQSVHHVWFIREHSNIEWIRQELSRISVLNLPDDFLKMTFYVTHGSETQITPVPEITNGEITVIRGRPSIRDVVAEEVKSRLGKLAVGGSFAILDFTNLKFVVLVGWLTKPAKVWWRIFVKQTVRSSISKRHSVGDIAFIYNTNRDDIQIQNYLHRCIYSTISLFRNIYLYDTTCPSLPTGYKFSNN